MLEAVTCVLKLPEWRCVQPVQNNISVSAQNQQLHVQARKEYCTNAAAPAKFFGDNSLKKTAVFDW